MNKNELEYELNIKTNECKMLNNTLMEMYRRNQNSLLIDSVQAEIMDKMKEISMIREQLLPLGDKVEDKVEYNFYDNVKKRATTDNEGNKKECSFYDSIIKQTKAYEYLDNEKKNIKNNLVYEDVYKKVKPYENVKPNKIRETIDKISLSEDKIMANLFLVDLSSIGINESHVRAVDFSVPNRTLYITIYDFLAEVESWGEFGKNKKVPIMHELERFKKNGFSFNFTISHLDREGNVIYKERYENTHISEIQRNSLDYESTNFSAIVLRISYNNVSYEAAN